MSMHVVSGLQQHVHGGESVWNWELTRKMYGDYRLSGRTDSLFPDKSSVLKFVAGLASD